MMELWKQKLYTHLLDFRQLVGPAVARVSRRRRGRGPGVRHRQVEHVPLALGRVRVAAAATNQIYVPIYVRAPFPASRLLQRPAVRLQRAFHLGGARRCEDAAVDVFGDEFVLPAIDSEPYRLPLHTVYAVSAI